MPRGGAIGRRQRGHPDFFALAAGQTGLATGAATVTDDPEPEAEVGDIVVVSPANVAAAVLFGGATGVFGSVNAQGNIRVTHAAAAGTEIFNWVLYAGVPV